MLVYMWAVCDQITQISRKKTREQADKRKKKAQIEHF